MQVRYGEGAANDIGPEPCAVVRKDGGEASVGECKASHSASQILLSRVPTPLRMRKATRMGVNASTQTARRGRRTGDVRKLVAWEPGYSTSNQALEALVRIGKVRSRSR